MALGKIFCIWNSIDESISISRALCYFSRFIVTAALPKLNLQLIVQGKGADFCTIYVVLFVATYEFSMGSNFIAFDLSEVDVVESVFPANTETNGWIVDFQM